MTTWTHLNSPMPQDVFEDEFCRLNNFRCLDEGAYAKVFGSEDCEYVYKIGYYNTVKRDPYLSYLKAISGKDNPLFPKIRTVTLCRHKYPDMGFVDKFFVVEMEKLHTFNANQSSRYFIELYDALTRHLSYGDEPVTSLMDNFLIKKIPQVNPVIKLLHRLGEKFCPDWHSSNMMMRADGHLVITDPVD